MTNAKTLFVIIAGNASGYQAALRGAAGDTRRFGDDVDRTGTSIDRLSGRITVLARTAAMIGPAIIPAAAGAAVGVGSLATQAGFAAGAAGSAVLAFQGMGDALKALEKARLDPTVENVRAAQEALSDLDPAAASLAMRLQDLRDEAKDLRDVAAAGLFPGVEAGLDSLLTRAPDAERVLHTLSDAAGDLFAEGAESLASSRWDDFFTFLATEARPNLDAVADSTGNVAHGLGEILMALMPLTHDTNDWLRSSTEGFDEWATRLDSTEGFRDFVDYWRETGPQVAETAGSIASALVDITEAAAPLGGPALQGLELVADVVSTIADSDFGTPLFTGLAAMSAFNTATSVWGKVSKSSAGEFVSGQVRATSSLRTLRGDLGAMRAEYGRVNAAQAVMLSGLSNTSGAAQRTRANLATLGKAGAGVGALALATTGLAEGMGLSNTTSLALLGTLAGPWGSAVGAGVGLVMDFSDALGKADEFSRRLDQSLESSTFNLAGMGEVVDQATTDLARYLEDVNSDNVWEGFKNAFDPDAYAAMFGGADEAMRNARWEAKLFARDMESAYASVARALDPTAFTGPGGMSMVPELEDLQKVADRVAPALVDLGITTEEFIDAAQGGGDAWSSMRNEIAAFLAHGDTAAGKSDAVARAISGLDDELLTTADSASALATALEGLFSPKLDLAAATDQWRAGLRNLKDELADTSLTLRGNTDAADKNRAAIRGQVTNLLGLMRAQADAGAGTGKLTRTLRSGRAAIMDAGEAAGISREQMREYLNTLGLTPRMVRTVIEARTEQAQAQVAAFNAMLAGIDRHVTVTINTVRNSLQGIVGSFTGADEKNARGGLYSGAVRQFAAGGFGQDGRYYDRVPQLVRGGANILWGEKSTGWEAYISGDPAHRRRNVAILGESARRLGMDAAPRGREYVGGGATVVHNHINQMPERLQLVLANGQKLDAYVRGHASAVVGERDSTRARHDGSIQRMDWS